MHLIKKWWGKWLKKLVKLDHSSVILGTHCASENSCLTYLVDGLCQSFYIIFVLGLVILKHEFCDKFGRNVIWMLAKEAQVNGHHSLKLFWLHLVVSNSSYVQAFSDLLVGICLFLSVQLPTKSVVGYVEFQDELPGLFSDGSSLFRKCHQ
jgi:hypothetical protein